MDGGWLPVVTISGQIFSTLVRTFYSRVTYGLGGPIISTIRSVEIQLDPESICRIFDIALVGLKGMGKPSTHSLNVSSRVLHHMICSILLPQGGHRDEVSYLEAFLIDSILIERRIHVGYMMMMHMISCCESTTRVLPYGRFLTRVFKDVGVDLSRETYFEAPSIYDTYDDQDERNFLSKKNSTDVPESESEGVQFEATFSESMMSEPTYTVGPSSQPSFIEPPHTETSPHQAPHAPDHEP
ncbi:hypothetical protein CK203_003441 [Vitis vinifera]|uniref:Putative plant transposon protein domain-containing protein n=1 Tax=Vitis vinifera TaxID=29760 RepID=A0A438K716_VITVI|nr:hypothetical protein CK203_003441 [Vitis vinifera]